MRSELEVLFRNDVVLVRLMALQANEVSPKHYHTQLLESVICVDGKIMAFTSEKVAPVVLAPGQSVSFPPLHVHWLENNGDSTAKYVLTQSGGAYDFCEVEG